MKSKIWKRVLAAAVSSSMVLTLAPAFGIQMPDTVHAEAVRGFSDVSRMVSAEGIVLLENPECASAKGNNETGKVLPVKNKQTVSIFGVVQDYYYSNGTGSGGGVSGINVDHNTTIADGLRQNPNVQVNEELASVYKAWIREHPFKENGGWTDNTSWSQEEMPLDEEVAKNAAEKSDMAVVILGRTAGEDHEAANVKGSYLLTDTEKAMLDTVYENFDRVAIVLNTAHIIDMKWAADYPNAAILYSWAGGMEGGSAVADVLTGDVTPSGKLNDTIAQDLEDYPAHENAMANAWESLEYEEDIYVGYRYFETFNPDAVLYPFGYGLSYTSFDINTEEVTFDEEKDKVHVNVTVENTGDVKGKEVVEVYYGAPQGELGKPVKQLAAFAKTGVLQPGEIQEMELSFDISDMASYDDSGATGHESCYVLEAGDYPIYVGNNVKDCETEDVYTVEETRVTEQLEEALAPTQPMQRLKPGEQKEDQTFEETYEDVPMRTVDYEKRIQENLPEEIERTEKKGDRLIDVYNGEITMDEFIGQFSDRDLAAIVIGQDNNDSSKGTTGVAGAFGAVTKSLEELGIPTGIAADGPSGIRANSSVKVTSTPSGTNIACSWNVDLVEQMYKLLGEEMLLNGIDTILGPGADIHRYPLGGRNFEYYSEDPLVAGMMLSNAARGIQSQGPTPTIKHFAANNLEKARREINTHISERALREIYLRGFEIAVKSGNVHSIMTSYNPINGTWTSSNWDLNTLILREEWGFKGILMTDWWATLGDDQEWYRHGGNGENGKAMIRSQQDLYMKKENNTVESNLGGMNQLSEYQKGNLTLGELQRTAKNICTYLLYSPALARLEGISYEPHYTEGEDWFKVEKDVAAGNPQVTEIQIDGKAIKGEVFHPLTLDYRVFHDAAEEFPEVTATVAEGTSITIEQASENRPAAVITATSGKEERIYKVIFADEDGLEPVFDDAAYAYAQEILINGKPMAGFQEKNFYYTVGVDDLSQFPEVTAVGKDGAKVEVTEDRENNQIHVRCISKDQANTYVLQLGQMPKSDEFDSETMDPVWYVNHDKEGNQENKEKWSLTANPGSLRIIGEQGDFWRGDSNLKNFFQQDAYGDWEATVKIDMNRQPYKEYMGTGIVVSEDNDNYLYLKWEQSGENLIGLYKETNANDPIPIRKITGNQIKEIFGDTPTIYLRMKKVGYTFTGYASPDGTTWTNLGTTAANYEHPKFGITASTGSQNLSEEFYADFDYVRFDYEPQTAQVNLEGMNPVLKVAQEDPASMTPQIYPAEDGVEGRYFTNCAKGEEVAYQVNVENAGDYRLSSRFKATNNNPLAQMSFTVYDGAEQLAAFSYIRSTNGEWVTRNVENLIHLDKGVHTLRIVFDTAGIDLNWLKFQLKQDNVDITKLTAKIEEAEAIDLSGYSDKRKQEFLPVLEAVKAVAQDPVNQETVDQALEDLTAAIAKLDEKIPPENIVPKKTEQIENGIRIRPAYCPWAYVGSDQFSIDGSGIANWGTVNDTFYLGKIDLTGLKEIRVNYSQGNTTDCYLKFYLSANDTKEPNKRVINTNEGSLDVYSGGDLQLSDELASIGFHQVNGLWEQYGTVTTEQVMLPDKNPQLDSYLGDEANYINKEKATGEQNVYFRMEQALINLNYIDLIYEEKETPTEKPDTEILEFALSLAKGADTTNVIPSIVEKFQAEIANVEDLLERVNAGDASVTQQMVDDSFENLILLMQYMEFKQGDKTNLQKVYDMAQSMNLEEYLEEGQTEFLDAKENAARVLADRDAMQEEVDQTWQELLKRMGELRRIPDKDALLELLGQAQQILNEEENYVTDSITVLRAAVKAASAVADNEQADLQDVTDAKTQLTAAISQVKEKEEISDSVQRAAEKQQVSNGNPTKADRKTVKTEKKEKDAPTTVDLTMTETWFALILMAGSVLIVGKKRK